MLVTWDTIRLICSIVCTLYILWSIFKIRNQEKVLLRSNARRQYERFVGGVLYDMLLKKGVSQNEIDSTIKNAMDALVQKERR